MGIGIVAGQEVIHTGLRLGGVPGLDGSLRVGGLAGLDDELAVIQIRLELVHCALIEGDGVGVVLRAGEDLQREGACLVFQIQLVDDVLSLQLAHADKVERDVEVDSLGVGDQAIVRDNIDPGILGLFTGIRQRGAVNSGDDQDVDALGDHVFDLHGLLGGIIFCVFDLRGVAGLLECFGQAFALDRPDGLFLGRHQNADGGFRIGCCGFSGFCGTCTEHGEEHGGGQYDCEQFFHPCFLHFF